MGSGGHDLRDPWGGGGSKEVGADRRERGARWRKSREGKAAGTELRMRGEGGRRVWRGAGGEARRNEMRVGPEDGRLVSAAAQ